MHDPLNTPMAFPHTWQTGSRAPEATTQFGMSLRAYIATAALQSIRADSRINATPSEIAAFAVAYADALIAELAK